MDHPELETMDYTKEVEFVDSDDEETGFVEVSEQTRTLLETKCTQSVPNDKRRRVKGKYPQPRVAATKTPKLDEFIRQVGKGEVSAAQSGSN